MDQLTIFEQYKERLINALRENMCDDGECQEKRLEAAILCLRGDVQHDQVAAKVLSEFKP